MALEYVFKSLDRFPRELTPTGRRSSSPFGKSWTEVQDLLERELRQLNYRRGSVILETAHSPFDVRKDGKLRADVRRPEHPGVVVRFDVYDSRLKKYVPMSFECDQFTEWKANVRAIADAMEALRKVNRYGVSGGGRQDAHYEGYKALPSAEGKTASRDEAAAFIAEHSGFSISSLADPDMLGKAYRKAAMKLHPDLSGDQEQFIKLQHAYKELGKGD